MIQHDDVFKWQNFPRHWPFVRGIHQSPVNSPHKGQWRGALMFSLICAWINGWINNREAGDLRHHRGHYDVTVMEPRLSCDFYFSILEDSPYHVRCKIQAFWHNAVNWHINTFFPKILAQDTPCLVRVHGFIIYCVLLCMMTSSNGNIFRVTGHLCGEFTGHRWNPRIKASDAEFWYLLWSAPE